MVRITAAELYDDFDRYRDLAQSQPLSVTENGKETLILRSADEYRRLKARDDDRQALWAWELSEAELEALDGADIPEEASQFDHEYERRGSV